jgi:putative membrane protein
LPAPARWRRAGPQAGGAAHPAMSFIIRLFVNAAALYVISRYNLFGIHADTIADTVIGALVLGVVNAIIRSILMVLSCPLIIITLGLFTLVLNGVIFYFVLELLPGWHISGYWSAFLGAIVLTVFSWIVSLIIRDVAPERRRFSQ